MISLDTFFKLGFKVRHSQVELHDDFWSPSSKQLLDFWSAEFTGGLYNPRFQVDGLPYVEGTIDLDPLLIKTVYKREKYFVNCVADIGGIAGVVFAVFAVFARNYNKQSKNLDEVRDFFKFSARNATANP